MLILALLPYSPSLKLWQMILHQAIILVLKIIVCLLPSVIHCLTNYEEGHTFPVESINVNGLSTSGIMFCIGWKQNYWQE